MPKSGAHLKNLKRKYEWLDFRRSYAEASHFEKNLVEYSHNCNIVVVRNILRRYGTPVAFGTIGVDGFQRGSNFNQLFNNNESAHSHSFVGISQHKIGKINIELGQRDAYTHEKPILNSKIK